MKYDVFISYATTDRPLADTVCNKLETCGLRCWIAPRDILPGMDWSDSIIDAIAQSSALVLVLSSSANESPQIKREVERAVNKGRTIIPLRVEDIRPSKSLEFFISTQHWLDALTRPLEPHLDRLVWAIQIILKEESNPTLTGVDEAKLPTLIEGESDPSSDLSIVESESTTPNEKERPSGPCLWLEVWFNSVRTSVTSVYAEDNIFTIGRHADNNLKLHDKEVSRRHAFIIFSDNSFTIVDGILKDDGSIKRSTNGIIINGIRRYQARLKEGDVIEIGETTLVVQSVICL